MIFKNYYISLLLLSFIFTQSSSELQQNIDENNRLLNNLENAIELLEKDINAMESSESDLSKFIEILNKKIDYRQTQIQILQQQDKKISELIATSKQKVLENKIQLDILKKQMNQRVKYLYKYGNTSIFSKMMSAKDWNKTLNRFKYFKCEIFKPKFKN